MKLILASTYLLPDTFVIAIYRHWHLSPLIRGVDFGNYQTHICHWQQLLLETLFAIMQMLQTMVLSHQHLSQQQQDFDLLSDTLCCNRASAG